MVLSILRTNLKFLFRKFDNFSNFQNIFLGRPVNEDEHVYHEIIGAPKRTVEQQETQFEDDLMAQYKTDAPPPEPEPSKAGTEIDDDIDESTVVKFLTGSNNLF